MTTIRSRGALPSASSAGVIKDEQLEGALVLAVVALVKLVGQTSYDTVAGWTEEQLIADPAKPKQKNAYIDAESYLALGFIPRILKNRQMSETGLEQRTIVGQSVTEFAPVVEGQKINREWELAALDALAPYLDILKLDSDGNPLSIKKGGFSITAL